MKHFSSNKFLLCLCLIFPLSVSAQLTLVKNKKAKTSIVVAVNDTVATEAAKMFQRFVCEITDVKLPIVCQADKQPSTHAAKLIISTVEGAKSQEDGFEIATSKHQMQIKGYGKGAVYAVATLLEQCLGVSYYTFQTYDLPQKTPSLILPAVNMSDYPAFRYRQVQTYALQDNTFKNWFRLEQPNEEFVENMWVHTFNRILPASVYGEKHPEWYSLINGKRQPGDHSQWCLTNEQLFEVVAAKVDSIFKAHPERTMISISQNDGNNTQCQCSRCHEVDSLEGSPSGNLVRFLNKLAMRFPDKQFSTLAYLYSMQPPHHVHPLPNVNIMLCDIDCKREVPLTDNASGQYFMKALKGWSQISDNIFVWDYGINFDNVVSPFPNFHILQPNLQTFKQHNAIMVFQQINSTLGTDLSELRTFLCSKLLWNPNQDVDSLMQAFLNGYYGKAAPYIYQYIKTMEGALLASDVDLWIYDSPVSHKHGMLNQRLRAKYNELFDKAEQVVAGDEEKLRRVQIAHLPVIYADLEIARTEPGSNVDDTKALLSRFESLTEKFAIPTLNERHNTPKDYCRLYRKRFLPTGKQSKALNASVSFIKQPAPRYQPIAHKALTDGLYGGTTYVESWVGWEGEDAEFIIDLGEEKQFSTIETDFLHQLGAWILLPRGGRYSISIDGRSFSDFGSFHFEEDRDVSVKFVPATVECSKMVSARYIKVYVETLGNCPSWHYGVGYPAWFFIDEVKVY